MNDFIVFTIALASQFIILIYILFALKHLNNQCSKIAKMYNLLRTFSYYSQHCSTLSLFVLRSLAYELLIKSTDSEEFEVAGYLSKVIKQIDEALQFREKEIKQQ